MTDWQPIETAPKDASDILVYSPKEDKVYIACWDSYKKEFIATFAEQWYIRSPSDWQPLPDPPNKNVTIVTK